MKKDAFFMTRSVYDAIIVHARDGEPEEVCGILRGSGDLAFDLVRGKNVAPDPVMDYVIDAQTLLRQFDFEEDGDEMVGVYHSHPVSPAYPSGSDAWSAHYPDAVYIICSLENDQPLSGRDPVVRAFQFREHDVALDVTELCLELDFDETRPGRFSFYQAQNEPLPPALDQHCSAIPRPFYIVFETSENEGKTTISRVVSIVERDVQIRDR
jgi:proteasome lid subunit RPN8/RPN11